MSCINLPYVGKNREYELWTDIQCIIGNATHWPKSVRLLFWKKNLTHWERLRITSFVYVNGLNPEVFLEWARFKGLCLHTDGYTHMAYLLNRYLHVPYNLYAWNVTAGQYQNVDGTPIYYKVGDYMYLHKVNITITRV